MTPNLVYMKKRGIALPLTLLIVGLLIALGAGASSTNNDVAESRCELGNSLSGIEEDCAQNDETIWYVIGGGLAALGLLGFVIRSALGQPLMGPPRRQRRPSTSPMNCRKLRISAQAARSPMRSSPP